MSRLLILSVFLSSFLHVFTLSPALAQRESPVEYEDLEEDLEERLEDQQDQIDILASDQMTLVETFRRFREALPFDFFGSLAVRHCAMANEKLDVLGNVLQMRLSAGVRGQVDEHWGYMLRLLSTENDSFNLSWYPFGGAPIARSPLFLDRYEIRWKAPQEGLVPAIDLRFGKSRNTLFETQLLFDEDVSFNGLQQHFTWRNSSPGNSSGTSPGTRGLQWQKAGIELHEDVLQIEETFITASLLAAKGVSEWATENLTLRSALSYLHYQGTSALATQTFNTGYRGPYAVLNRTVTGTANQSTYVSDFRLLNMAATARWQPAPEWPPLSLMVDGVYNLGARDRNLGAFVGLEVGQLKQVGDMQLDYSYRWMEQDYQVALFADEFYAGNDVQGHTLSLSYLMTLKTRAIATLVTRQRITEPELGVLTIAYLTLRQDF